MLRIVQKRNTYGFNPILLNSSGGSLVQVYHFDENTELEFYLNHQEEFSYIILYSEENIDYNKVR